MQRRGYEQTMRRKPNNPRQISKTEYARLQADLERFGDLGGIVHNATTDNLVGGNQRASVFDLVGKGAEIVITEEYDPPTRTGTTARGYVLWGGEKYDYRRVAWDEATEDAACITANLRGGVWDFDVMVGFDADLLTERGFDAGLLASWNDQSANLALMLEAEKAEVELPEDEQAHSTLAERFIVPPFSVLDARQGYWQERKRAWLALGLQSELGRGTVEKTTGGHHASPACDYGASGERNMGTGTTLGAIAPNEGGANGILARTGKYATHAIAEDFGSGGSGTLQAGYKVRGKLPADSGGQPLPLDRRRGECAPPDGEYDYPVEQLQNASGTSIFDPVLCELAYSWFTPKGARVLDPFAGGSVRGIVAAYLGREYVGIDLRAEQVQANEKQGRDIVPDAAPVWIVGDSRDAIPQQEFDFVLSCPPYYDLEIYSDDPQDISNAEDYATFLEVYRDIIAQSVARLRDDRFACFVVGDVRDKRGNYYDFVGDTVQAFRDAGCEYYNEAILVTAVGSLPIRVGRQFASGRKLGKTHQNVLVFVKGDGKRAAQWCGPVDVADLG